MQNKNEFNPFGDTPFTFNFGTAANTQSATTTFTGVQQQQQQQQPQATTYHKGRRIRNVKRRNKSSSHVTSAQHQPLEEEDDDDEDIIDIKGHNSDDDDDDDWEDIDDDDSDFDDDDDSDYETLNPEEEELADAMTKNIMNNLARRFVQQQVPDVNRSQSQKKKKKNNAGPKVTENLNPQQVLMFWVLVRDEIHGYFPIARDAFTPLLEYFHFSQGGDPMQALMLDKKREFEKEHFSPDHGTLLTMLTGGLMDKPATATCPKLSQADIRVANQYIMRQKERVESLYDPSEGWKDQNDMNWNDDDDDDEEEEDDDEDEAERNESELVKEERVAWKDRGIDLYRFEVGEFQPPRSYRSQYRLKVDSNNKLVYVYFQQYVCNWKKYTYPSAMAHLYSHMNDFKVSRVMRLSFPIDDITGVHFYKHVRKNDPGKGVLVLRVKQPPVFETKRVAVTSHLRSEWRRRSDFTTNKSASKYDLYYFMASDENLTRIVALMTVLSPSFKRLYESKRSIGTPSEIINATAERTPVFTYDKEKDESVTKQPKEKKPLELSQDVIDYLLQVGILSQQDKNNEKKVLQRIGGNCFYDYACNSSEEKMEDALNKKFKCDSCGTSETVLNLMKSKGRGCTNSDCENYRDSDTYYSFCYGNAVHVDHDSHCSRCHECVDWHYWHCSNCDRCSYGQSIPQCEWCGSSSMSFGAPNGKKPKVKPLDFGRMMRGYDSDDEEEEYEGYDSELDEPSFVTAPEPPAFDSDPSDSLETQLLMQLLLSQMGI
jgi:hypothetical protein